MKTCKRAFTLIEMLVVIAIIGILAALIVSLTGISGAKKVQSRVRTELNQLVGTIESYHKKEGFYPPDHTKLPNLPSPTPSLTLTTNQVTALYYELIGTEPLNDPPSVYSVLGVEGIANSGTNSQNFHHNLKPSGFEAIPKQSLEILLLVVPYKGPGGEYNPWHYNSSSPEHNPETYDLWAEVLVNGKTEVIGNWKD